MKKLMPFLVFSFLLGITSTGIAASPNSSELTESEKTFSKCVDEKRNVSVLYLVDESKSLQKSDPQNRRVDAIEGSIRAFYSMVKSSKNLKKPFAVDIKIAGFSNGYASRSNWVRLEQGADNFAKADENLESLLQNVANIGGRNTVPFTNTSAGLQNSINEIVSARNSDQTSCRMLLFFSDGEMDLDNNPNSLNEQEQRGLKTTICGKDQIADQLRQNEIFTATIGLSVMVGDSKPNLGLMELLSTNRGEYSRTRKTGSGVFSLTSCGTLPAYGAHVESSNPDDLVKNLIKFTPDAPNSPVTLGRCSEEFSAINSYEDNSADESDVELDAPDKAEQEQEGPILVEECRQVTFSINDVTRSFKILVTRSDPQQRVGLFSPGDRGSVEDLFQGDDSTKQVSIFPLGSKSSLVEVTRSDEVSQPWSGNWSIVFRGPKANSSTVDVKFIGGLSVKLNANDSSGKNRVTRDETKDLDFEIVSATKAPVSFPMDNVELSVLINGTTMKVSARDVTRGIWFLSESQVKSLITGSGVFARASSMKIEVRPSANIEISPAQTVKILFDPTIEEIAISNGNGYPTCVPSGIPISLKKVDKLKIDLTCTGPKQGAGFFEFKSVEVAKSSFDPMFRIVTTNDDLKCRIEQNAQRHICSIELQPKESHNGSIKLVLNATSYGTDPDAVDAKPSNINLVIEMSRPTKTEVLWWWIIGLIVFFILVQAVIRAAFSMAMSRFEPLDVNYRSLALPVTLLNSADGVKIRRNGSGLYAAESEASNLVDLDHPKTKLSIDEFTFGVSWLETFLKVGTTPKGRVTSTGSFVFGSGGVSTVKNGFSVGLVNLALPSQWVIAVDADAFTELRLGKIDQANARILCILKPFESFGNGIENQLSEVNVEILTKLAAMFGSIEIKQDEAEIAEDSSTASSDGGWTDGTTSGWDSAPVSNSDSPDPTPKKNRQKKLKKEKKKKNSDFDSTGESGWSSDDSSSGWN